jgi:hypothetical protein
VAFDVGVCVSGARSAPPSAAGGDRDASRLRQAFLAALACFVVAGLTGSLLRFGVLYGLPFELQFLNVRHGHTHLMYFGWVTPALFALIGLHIARLGARPLPRLYHVGLTAALISGILAYPPFLVSGYQLTAVGEGRLPLSMMAASVAVLSWYVWAGGYLVATWRLRRDAALFALDFALLALLVASAGAWGLALVGLAPFASPAAMQALVRFYLDTFSHGWFALALLGLLLAALPAVGRRRVSVPALVAVLGGVLTYVVAELLGWPLVASVARLLAAVGTVTLAALLSVAAVRARRFALAGVTVLALAKGLVDGGLTLPTAVRWSERMLLSVPLLHAYLLGFVTLALVLLALRAWRPAVAGPFWWLSAAVASMLAGLLPLTGLWPAPLRGPWALHLAAWTSLVPTLVMLSPLVVLLGAGPRPGAAPPLPTPRG